MKHIIFLSFLTVISLSAKAQIEIDKMERLLLDKKDSIGLPSYKAFLNLSGDFYVNSNSVTNSFIKSLVYKGDFIDEQMKDHESKRLKRHNRLGVEESLYLNGMLKGKKMNYVFGIGQRAVLASRFSPQLFEMIFRGNSIYAGENADLSHTHIRFFDYQSVYGGVQKELKEGKYTIGGALSLIRGGNYVDMQMKNAYLYTEPSGQYVEYNGDLNFSRYTYNGLSSALKSHGKGAGVNLCFSMKHNKNRLNVEVRDLGFIVWKDTKNYSGDSSFRYNGLVLDDLLGNSIVQHVTVDSVALSAGIKIEHKNKTMALPTIFHVNYMVSPNRRFTGTIGMRYMMAPGYIPKVYIRGADYLEKGFTVVTTVSYGGFGRADFELGLMKKFKNSFVISANLFAFEYLVLPGHSSGHGFNFGLTKLF